MQENKPESLATSSPPPALVQGPSLAEKEKEWSRLAARERNPRRKATKAYREAWSTTAPVISRSRQRSDRASVADSLTVEEQCIHPVVLVCKRRRTEQQDGKALAVEGRTSRRIGHSVLPFTDNGPDNPNVTILSCHTRQNPPHYCFLPPTPLPAESSQRRKDMRRSTLSFYDARIGSSLRPVRDPKGDQRYAAAVIAELSVQAASKAGTIGYQQAARISNLLKKAEYASDEDVDYLSTKEAAARMAPRMTSENLMVTEGQQALPLQTVSSFLQEYYGNETKVWIQDPGTGTGARYVSHTRQVSMEVVKARFAAGPTAEPWNLLELSTHHDDGLRPAFLLNNEDCRLLTKLKIPFSAKEARRRTIPQGYKEVEKWALLAQAGALTEPHQDNHGYSTYITINQGKVGFGWLSHPTAAQRKAWLKSPGTFQAGNWRYVVLHPGQTIYFGAGTVHFVFRLTAAGDSLAFGGFVLRCSTLVSWVKTLLEQRANPHVANEDITNSAKDALEQVAKFVRTAKSSGQHNEMERWGGVEAIDEFLKLQALFLSNGA